MKLAGFVRYGSIMLLALGAGCADTEALDVTEGNATLGIASFEVDETATKTTVVGLDADHNVVGRVELVHGQFALTGIYKDDYPGQSSVDGRKLDVDLQGEKLTFETAGFEPLLHLPAHPIGQQRLDMFLTDPHVKAVLDRWQLEFEPVMSTEDELAYGSITGTYVANCDGQSTCGGTVRGYPANTCGGGGAALMGGRLHHTSPYSEDSIIQCCPSGTGGQSTNWFAIKKCPLLNTTSSCGTASAACKGCPGYPVNAAGLCWEYTNTGGSSQYCKLSPTQKNSCDSSWNGVGCSGELPWTNDCRCECPCQEGIYQCG